MTHNQTHYNRNWRWVCVPKIDLSKPYRVGVLSHIDKTARKFLTDNNMPLYWLQNKMMSEYAGFAFDLESDCNLFMLTFGERYDKFWYQDIVMGRVLIT